MTLQAVILAAGRGSRLMPFTERCTKGMAPIVGKPIARRVMEQFLPYGIRDFILVIHPGDEEIRPYFEADAKKTGYQITFVKQTEQKGMAHALLQAVPHIHTNFFLSACDNLVYHSVVSQMIQALTPGISSVLLLKPVTLNQVSSTGIVEFEGNRIIRIHEKPKPEEATSLISSLPMYLLRHEICDYLYRVKPSFRGEYELQDAMELMLPMGEMRGITTDWRLTLTNVADLFAINLYMLQQEQPCWIAPTANINASAALTPPYFISADVVVNEGVHLGPNVYLGPGTYIHAGAYLQDAVILQQAIISPGETVRNQLRY